MVQISFHDAQVHLIVVSIQVSYYLIAEKSCIIDQSRNRIFIVLKKTDLKLTRYTLFKNIPIIDLKGKRCLCDNESWIRSFINTEQIYLLFENNNKYNHS